MFADNDMDSVETKPPFCCGDVPPPLLACARRVEDMVKTIEIMKGWDPDVASERDSTVLYIAEARKNIRLLRSCLSCIETDVQTLNSKSKRLLPLSQRGLYMRENIPERFSWTGCSTASSKPINGPGASEEVSNVLQPAARKLGATVQQVTTVPPVSYLTTDEFDSIPKYMKGRISYEKVNAFIDTFNAVLVKKYTIFKKKKTSLKKHNADLWIEFKKQDVKETQGLFFCVANDLKTFANCTMDKTTQNMVTILRHCGRIREIRTSGIVRFVATY